MRIIVLVVLLILIGCKDFVLKELNKKLLKNVVIDKKDKRNDVENI